MGDHYVFWWSLILPLCQSFPAFLLDANIANLLKNMEHSARLAHLLIFYALICVLDIFLAVVKTVKPSLRGFSLYFN